MNRIAAIVLAAGASTRMGEDKALLDWHGRTLLARILAQLHAAGVGIVRVVLGANRDAVVAHERLQSDAVVHNPDWESGMLSSLVAGLDSLPAGSEAALVWPVDHPCISTDLLRTLIRKFESGGRTIVLPVHRGRRGHPVIFGAAHFDELRAAPSETGARYVVRSHPDAILEVETDEDGVLLNVNDGNAYAAIRSRRPPIEPE